MAEPAHHQRPESWGEKAKDYDELFVPFSEGVARAALEEVALEPGEKFLDVAAGTGAVALHAARAGADVTAIDFSEAMLTRLGSKLGEPGLGPVDTRVMDGQALAFEDDRFDVAGSNLGLIFFPDLGAGLREMKRVLRPGGRAFVTSLPQRARLMQLVMAAVLETVSDFRPRVGPAPIPLSDPDTMAEALSAAGFSDVRVCTASLHWPVADAADFWKRWVLGSPPTAPMMAELDPAQQQLAGARFAEKVAAEAHEGAAIFDQDALIGIGTA